MDIFGSIEPEEALRLIVTEARNYKQTQRLTPSERFNVGVIIEDGEKLLRDFRSHDVPNVVHHWRRFTIALLHVPKLASVAFADR